METTFENATIGDKVWSVEFGWGKISSVKTYGNDKEICVVDFTIASNILYLENGERYADYPTYRTLFWDEIPIVPPTKPKRKVRKWFKLFVRHDGQIAVHGADMYPTLYDEKPVMGKNDIGPFEFLMEE